MEESGPGAGSLISPRPPENPVIQISDHGPESLISDHVVHNDNNMAGKTAGERTSRSKVRSTSVGGGNTLDPLDPHRKASAERRKRERENVKAQEVDAFRAIVRDCKTADIATNVHLVQMQVDQGKIRENQQDMGYGLHEFVYEFYEFANGANVGHGKASQSIDRRP
jgi:hypothetical protein